VSTSLREHGWLSPERSIGMEPLSLGALWTLQEELDLINTLKEKLTRQPDPALDHLVTVLDEIVKIYEALDSEVTRYLSVMVDPSDPKELRRERKALLSLEGGKLFGRMAEARGHCSKITLIYQRHLKRWLADALSPREAELMARLFDDLGDSDTIMVDSIDEVGGWLVQNAEETLNLIDAGEYEAANQRVRAARREVSPSRLRMAKAIYDLRSRQADFIAVTGAL
jgi:hypothetical protein